MEFHILQIFNSFDKTSCKKILVLNVMRKEYIVTFIFQLRFKSKRISGKNEHKTQT